MSEPKNLEGYCNVCDTNTSFRLIYSDLDFQKYSLYKCTSCGVKILSKSYLEKTNGGAKFQAART